MVKLCSSLSWLKITLKCKYLRFYCEIIFYTLGDSDLQICFVYIAHFQLYP